MRTLLHCDDGSTVLLEPHRWWGQPSPEEERVLGQVVGPALDVGCGPGRHVLALARMGVPTLGIDISPVAVTVARDRGATVLQRCVFRPLPLHAAWRTVLLLDGNIGIGGCPATLLRRVGQLLEPGGRALVEVDPPGTRTGPMRARVERGAVRGPWFAWARVAASRLPQIAEWAGLAAAVLWESEGRWFARLDRPASRAGGLVGPASRAGGRPHRYPHHEECAQCGHLGRGGDSWAAALSEGA